MLHILAHSSDFLICQMNYIWHMDFSFCWPLYGQFPSTTGLFTYNYSTCSFLQSLLTMWMHISCSYDMSYVITFDICVVRIMSSFFGWYYFATRLESYNDPRPSTNQNISLKSGSSYLFRRLAGLELVLPCGPPSNN